MDHLSGNRVTRIQALLGGFVPNAESIAPEQDLRELGMTSMQMVNFMLSIEAEFDITIPSSKLVPSNFRTIERIDTFLRDVGH